MYKIIACDLDETLLNRDHQVSAKDIETIKKLTEHGIKFVVATGRGYNSTFALLKQLGLYGCKGEYVISFNGGMITDNYENEVFYRKGITFKQASDLYLEGVKRNLCIHVYTEELVYVYNYIDEEREYIEGRMPIVETFEKTIDFLRDDPIIKILYMSTDVPLLQQVEKEVAGYSAGLSVSYSSNRYLEFNNRNADKGVGLVRLAEMLNVDLKDTIAIGDNINDLPMLKAAGLGIGVRNSNPDIWKDCDLILDSTNNEDPITEVYNRFYNF